MEFSTEKFKVKNDLYLETRGGTTKFLYISCSKCNEPIMVYQKDMNGALIRWYADRIVWASASIAVGKSVFCSKCGQLLANPMIYEPEKRDAFRIIIGSVHKYRSIEQAKAREN